MKPAMVNTNHALAIAYTNTPARVLVTPEAPAPLVMANILLAPVLMATLGTVHHVPLLVTIATLRHTVPKVVKILAVLRVIKEIRHTMLVVAAQNAKATKNVLVELAKPPILILCDAVLLAVSTIQHVWQQESKVVQANNHGVKILCVAAFLLVARQLVMALNM